MKFFQENGKKILFVCAAVFVVLGVMTIANIELNEKLAVENNDLSEEQVYKYHVAMIGSNPSDEFWMSIYEGAKEEGKNKEIYIENFGENLATKYSVEELLEMAIAAKVDGIVLEADRGESLKVWIDEAESEGIPVMTILSDASNSSRISFVSGNDYALGELYGSQIIEDVMERKESGDAADKVRVKVLLNSSEENSVPNLIYSGIKEEVAPMADNIELTTSLIDNSGEFESEETIRGLVLNKEYPQILVALSAIDTISAYQSVVDYNMVGKITIIGYYSSQDILEMVQKGVIKSTISINAEEMGKTAVDGMYEFLVNEYVSEYLPVSSELITEKNVGEYMEDGAKDSE